MVACKYTNIERALSDRLGKKVHVLVANSYPPFFREREVQVVYKAALQDLLVFSMTLLTMLSIYDSLREASRRYIS
jgi:hypothetical protein